MDSPKVLPRVLPADAFAASTAAPGSSRASTDSEIRFRPLTESIPAANCPGQPHARARCPAGPGRSCSSLTRPRARRSPGRCSLLHRFINLRQRGGAVRCRGKGAVRHGGGRQSRLVAVTGGPVQVVTRHETAENGRGTAVPRRGARRPVLGTVPIGDGRG